MIEDRNLCGALATLHGVGYRREAFFGNIIATGDALTVRSLLDPLQGRIDCPNLVKACLADAFKDLVTLALRRTFLSIRITRLIEFMLNMFKALLQLCALVTQHLLEILHVGHLCILSLVFSWTYHYQTSVPG